VWILYILYLHYSVKEWRIILGSRRVSSVPRGTPRESSPRQNFGQCGGVLMRNEGIINPLASGRAWSRFACECARITAVLFIWIHKTLTALLASPSVFFVPHHWYPLYRSFARILRLSETFFKRLISFLMSSFVILPPKKNFLIYLSYNLSKTKYLEHKYIFVKNICNLLKKLTVHFYTPKNSIFWKYSFFKIFIAILF